MNRVLQLGFFSPLAKDVGEALASSFPIMLADEFPSDYNDRQLHSALATGLDAHSLKLQDITNGTYLMKQQELLSINKFAPNTLLHIPYVDSPSFIGDEFSESLALNTTTPITWLKSARQLGIDHVILISDTTEWDFVGLPPYKEDAEIVPRSIHGHQSLFTEKSFALMAESLNINYTILRVPHLLTTSSQNRVINTIESLAFGNEHFYDSRYRECLSFLFSADVATAIAYCMAKKIYGVYNIGSLELFTKQDICDLLGASNMIIDCSNSTQPSFLQLDSTEFESASGWKSKYKFTEWVQKFYFKHQR